MIECSFSELREKKTLIVGEVGTGKTVLTRRLLFEAVNQVSHVITVLDFAPPAQKVKGVNIGGYLLEDSHPKVNRLYSKLIKTPRLSAKNSDEVIKLANYNKKITDSLITKFLDAPTDTVFINDISIHFQQGKLDELWDAINSSSTVVANGYMGTTLMPDHGSGISMRENSLMRKLAVEIDKMIKLDQKECLK